MILIEFDTSDKDQNDEENPNDEKDLNVEENPTAKGAETEKINVDSFVAKLISKAQAESFAGFSK